LTNEDDLMGIPPPGWQVEIREMANYHAADGEG
jgi:hypothetical protein